MQPVKHSIVYQLATFVGEGQRERGGGRLWAAIGETALRC